MKTQITSAFWCVVLMLLAHCACHARDWSSPDGSATLTLQTANPSTGSLDHLHIEGTPIKFVSHSPIRRENHGFDWMNSVSPTWLGNRFVAFEDDMGLCLVDTQQRTILLDQVFTAYTKSPDSDMWVAIRYRPTSRNQEKLTGNEKDTVWFIKPAALAESTQMVTDDNPFAHVAAVQVNGISVASPHWSEDGAGVAIIRQLDGKVAADVFDPKTIVLVRTVPLQDMTLTQEQLLSVWIIPEIDRMASEAIKANHVFDMEKSQMKPTRSVKHPKVPSELTNTDPATSPTSRDKTKFPPGFPIMLVAIVAAVIIGIVFFILRRKST